MNPKWKMLAGDLLHLGSDRGARAGCDDWSFPVDWTPEERAELVRAMHADNGNLAEFDPGHPEVPGWWVMAFLGDRLREEGDPTLIRARAAEALLLAGFLHGFADTDRYALTDHDREMFSRAGDALVAFADRPDLRLPWASGSIENLGDPGKTD